MDCAATRLPVSRFGTGLPVMTQRREEKSKSEIIPQNNAPSTSLQRSSRVIRHGSPPNRAKSNTPKVKPPAVTAPMQRSSPPRVSANSGQTINSSVRKQPLKPPAIAPSTPSRIPGVIWATQGPRRSRSIKKKPPQGRAEIFKHPRSTAQSQSIPSKTQTQNSTSQPSVKPRRSIKKARKDSAISSGRVITRSRSIKKRNQKSALPPHKHAEVSRWTLACSMYPSYDSSAGDLSSAGMSCSSSGSRSLTFRPFTPVDDLTEHCGDATCIFGFGIRMESDIENARDADGGM
ncbi:hypothetical protein FRC02_010570 [Tulasnella sp. 418]|nr:hypothetical protein FRC02_010570 [Tulasnella sp. 418]